MASKVDLAVSRLNAGLSCSQAILATYAVQDGLDMDMALRLACGFGAGMGRLAQTCGAVTGAFMVLGLLYDTNDRTSKEIVYSAVQEFNDEFMKRNGSTVCKDLLGYDMSTQAGFLAARKQGVVKTVCPKMVRDAAEIIEWIFSIYPMKEPAKGAKCKCPES
jgi:C_GCAxxG_C_C family probable redox protein